MKSPGLAACSERIRTAKGNPVTANELLALLGRAWSRLLIYPGGLAAFGIVCLISMLQNREPRTTQWVPNREPDRQEGSQFLVLSSVVLPWLALALLPLPLAVELPRQIDIVVALALLEWPNVLAIRRELWTGDMRRLTAALNSYPPLILATLALAQASNSLELGALARAPGDSATTSTRALHWLGVIALALALPPALGLGPFADDRRPTTDDRRPANLPVPNPQSPIHNSPLRCACPRSLIPTWIARFFAAGTLQLGLRLRA